MPLCTRPYQLSTCARRAVHEKKRAFASRGCRPHTGPIVFFSSFLLFQCCEFGHALFVLTPRRRTAGACPFAQPMQTPELSRACRWLVFIVSRTQHVCLFSFFFSPAECSTCLPSRRGVLSAECNIKSVARRLTKQGQRNSPCFIPGAV